MSDEINRLLGEHSATLEHLKGAVDKIDANVTTLLADKNQREGGKKTLLSLAAGAGGLAGAIGSAIASVFSK